MAAKNRFITEKAFIGGEWLSAKSGETFEVRNPSTGELLGNLANCSVSDTELAIERAHKAFQSWKDTTAMERSTLLKKWNHLILENKAELAKLLTLEMGKPIRESFGEIMFGASMVEWSAEECKRVYGDVIPTNAKSKRMVVIKQPVGVCGVITPWNFPSAMVTRTASAALAAGCTVVLKPAEDTPYSALALAKLAEEAGLPAGVFSVVTSDRPTAAKVGQTLCSSQLVKKISFTGSTATGKILLRQSADTVKKVSMELGGNAAFIVFDTANVDMAVDAAMICKFRNTGQTCISANRILVQSGIYEQFCHKLSKAMTSELKVGDGFEDGVTQGPLINGKALEKVERHVNDAVKKGAEVILGGKRSDRQGNFYQPTLLSEINIDMLVCQEETFGPVAPVIRFETEKEAVLVANSTNAGLAGYFYTGDIAQAWRVAENLEVGLCGINEGLVSAVEAPFGGVKESGMGREGGKYGLQEFMNIKYLCFGI